MRFQVTVRYGVRAQRYHTYAVEAGDARSALQAAASGMPAEIVVEADLIEVRVAVDPEARAYVGD